MLPKHIRNPFKVSKPLHPDEAQDQAILQLKIDKATKTLEDSHLTHTPDILPGDPMRSTTYKAQMSECEDCWHLDPEDNSCPKNPKLRKYLDEVPALYPEDFCQDITTLTCDFAFRKLRL